MSGELPEAEEEMPLDDDMPLLDRVCRYCRSNAPLQRLVHVKMLAETAETVGSVATVESLIPVFGSLIVDPESIIRLHVAAQLLPVSLVAMIQNVGFGKKYTVQEMMDKPSLEKEYYDKGYRVVTSTVVSQINALITDPELDVRRSASDALAGLALQLMPDDVAAFILPIPLRLVHTTGTGSKNKSSQNEQENHSEDLRITAANLLAKIGGAAAEHGTIPTELVQGSILPAVLSLADDPSVRVRRCSAQALPRVLGGSTLEVVQNNLLPAFEKLSNDDLYRVRKSTGECLVDMSRSFMILAGRVNDEERAVLHELRRTRLIPIVERLVGDSSRMVRHGMMQFLGPFIASFYPYVDSALHTVLPGTSESDGSNHTGIVAQFFPHASSMVSRLNSPAAPMTLVPTPISVNVEEIINRRLTLDEQLQQALPQFIRASHLSALTLNAVVAHRKANPPQPDDIEAVVGSLLQYFAALAMVTTGDESTDAEMRVYCAYSYPAVALVLGAENWDGLLRTCFLTLLNPQHDQEAEEGEQPEEAVQALPLPVKRCLASSLHTVAHILGPELASSDILPLFRDNFLPDPDNLVRLNVFRNFPSLLSLLKPVNRLEYLVLWSEMILGEGFLGTKVSNRNPLVLNWRQRDYLARSLPDLLLLVSPKAVMDHIWPIIRILVLDNINIVREDVTWAIPVLFQAYSAENFEHWHGRSGDARKMSHDACVDVVNWLKGEVLKSGSKSASSKQHPVSSSAGFSMRQLYCHICSAVGIAIRFGEMDIMRSDKKSDPVGELATKYKKAFAGDADAIMKGPYLRLSSNAQQHLKQILVEQLLPSALQMNEDRIMNVRLGLLKVLELMPRDVIERANCAEILQGLEEEVETWETFDAGFQPQQATAPQRGREEGMSRNSQYEENAKHGHDESRGEQVGQGSSDEESEHSGSLSPGGSSDEGSYVSEEGLSEGSYSGSEDELRVSDEEGEGSESDEEPHLEDERDHRRDSSGQQQSSAASTGSISRRDKKALKKEAKKAKRKEEKEKKKKEKEEKKRVEKEKKKLEKEKKKREEKEKKKKDDKSEKKKTEKSEKKEKKKGEKTEKKEKKKKKESAS